MFADAGPSLTDLSPVSPWIVRSAISYELFQLTSFLTKTNLNLAFYPTDWSSDHFSVDKYVLSQTRPIEKYIIDLISRSRPQ